MHTAVCALFLHLFQNAGSPPKLHACTGMPCCTAMSTGALVCVSIHASMEMCLCAAVYVHLLVFRHTCTHQLCTHGQLCSFGLGCRTGREAAGSPPKSAWLAVGSYLHSASNASTARSPHTASGVVTALSTRESTVHRAQSLIPNSCIPGPAQGCPVGEAEAGGLCLLLTQGMAVSSVCCSLSDGICASGSSA